MADGRFSFANIIPGYIDWTTFEANQARIDANEHPRPTKPEEAHVRRRSRIAEGLASCGKLWSSVTYALHGQNASPGLPLCGKDIRFRDAGVYCLHVAACNRSSRGSMLFSKL